MKVKIFLAALSLGLASCESMDLVPKSQGNTASWYTNETELSLAANEFYILGIGRSLCLPLSSGVTIPPIVCKTETLEVVAPS